MITAFSGVGFGDCENQRFLHRAFYTTGNRARLVEEFAELTYELYREYAGSGKRFILSNWEGDNAVYCGAAYRYAAEPEFRDACDAAYPEYYGGNTGPADSIVAMRQWFMARWEGIEQGRQRARSKGYRGVGVYSAPEISMVRALQAAGLPSVLYDVIPHVPFDYISYSAWESINRPELAEALSADLDTIRAVAGTEAIILGEIGFSEEHWGKQALPRTAEAIQAAADWGVPLVFQWVLFDYDPAVDRGFGLFDEWGALTTTGEFYRALFTGGTSTFENGVRANISPR